MALQMGFRSRARPLTADVFGEGGSKVFKGQVFPCIDFNERLLFWGLNVSMPQEDEVCRDVLFHHPELIRSRGRQMGDLTNYQLALEDGKIVARQLEFSVMPERATFMDGGGEFRASPLELGGIHLHDIVRFSEMFHLKNTAQRGPLCSRGLVCRGSQFHELDFKRSALIRLEREERIVCAHCASEMVRTGEQIKAEDVIVDARQLVPWADVGYGQDAHRSGTVPLDVLLFLIEKFCGAQSHVRWLQERESAVSVNTCKHPKCSHGDGLKLMWGQCVIAIKGCFGEPHIFCGDCYDQMVRVESQASIDYTEGLLIDGRQVQFDQTVPCYNEIPRRVR